MLDSLKTALNVQLLERDPHRRLGSGIGGELEDVKRQPWFSSIDWDKLNSKEIVPSLVPDVRVPPSRL